MVLAIEDQGLFVLSLKIAIVRLPENPIYEKI